MQLGMSAKCQKRTLFDDVIGAREQSRRNSEPQRLGCSEIDCQFKFGRRLDGADVR